MVKETNKLFLTELIPGQQSTLLNYNIINSLYHQSKVGLKAKRENRLAKILHFSRK